MTVVGALATKRETWDEPATIQGHLVVTVLFSYLAYGADDARGVLVDEPRPPAWHRAKITP
jgi:hypothetical protein